MPRSKSAQQPGFLRARRDERTPFALRPQVIGANRRLLIQPCRATLHESLVEGCSAGTADCLEITS